MAETYKQNLSQEQLESGVIPSNTVMVEMMHSSEGIETNGGIILGHDLDVEFDDETTSHVADLSEVYGKVYKLPDKLYYNKDGTGMPWDCDMELRIGDLVWFNAMESKNAVEIVCEDKLYKLLPYSDVYCVKRRIAVFNRMIRPALSAIMSEEEMERIKVNLATPKDIVIMLNGYVLLEPLYLENKSFLAVDKQGDVDKTRGIVRFVGKPNREYVRESYVDFPELNLGDEVLLSPNTALFYLERKSYLSSFDNGKLYWVVQRRRIAMVLSENISVRV